MDDRSSIQKTRKKILVVAFGDSLTSGYQPPGPGSPLPKSTPYTDPLKKMIDKGLEKVNKLKLVDVTFYNKGVSGELTSDMLRRLEGDVLSVKPNYTIILGGSNDIGWSVDPSDILDNLVQMYEKSAAANIEVVACTIPSIIGPETYIKPRLELNELISDYCFENELVCVDLFAATADPKTKMLDKRYSSDGLHLNTAGYTKMAEAIFNQAFSRLIPVWTIV
jgi:lysophospholipase L1-like esterase